MPKLLTHYSQLRQIRDASNAGKGMSAQEVANKLAAILGEHGRTYESVIQMERRGVKSYPILKALATIYNKSVEEIEEAANPAKNL